MTIAVTEEDRNLIDKIADKAMSLAPQYAESVTQEECQKYLTVCHARQPLDLARLLQADGWPFLRDVIGILEHLDLQTGKLARHFQPQALKYSG
jgi:hypothetical protein